MGLVLGPVRWVRSGQNTGNGGFKSGPHTDPGRDRHDHSSAGPADENTLVENGKPQVYQEIRTVQKSSVQQEGSLVGPDWVHSTEEGFPDFKKEDHIGI